jgi:hypothetical protein
MVRDHFGDGGGHHGRIAADVVWCSWVFRIWVMCQPLTRAVASVFSLSQRVDRQRLARVGAGHQVVEVAQRIAGPDSLDDHFTLLGTVCMPRRPC